MACCYRVYRFQIKKLPLGAILRLPDTISPPISNRDIAARGYPVISGWGANQIPLCSFQKRKAAYIPPENRGYARPGSNLLPENSGYWLGMFPLVAMLCKVTFQIEPLKDEIRCLAALPCLCNV